jgi:serine/threonine protein kinase
MGVLNDWERVRDKELGSSGQSTVYLVRRPERKAARDESFAVLKNLSSLTLNPRNAFDFATASADISRKEEPSELGALKKFTPRAAGPSAEVQALLRMQNEIKVLKQNRRGLLKLLDSNESEGWIVTEYCPGGTLADHLLRFKGNAKRSLTAFFSLVKTALDIHKDKIVHRDIKPQNVFMGDGDELLLGDFGIVFLPNQPERLSVTGESVGPRDFMPPWVFLNDEPGEINPSFDVYMLGKVLWCMVTGRLKLHREEFLHPSLNVVKLWPNDPYMHMINTILAKCVVAHEEDCLRSAQDLYLMVGAYVEMLERGGQPLTPGVPRPCRVCGVGFYGPEKFERTSPRLNPNETGLRFWSAGNSGTLPVRVLVCNTCGHLELFSGAN